jgi:membrane protein DedA with SNARE-associated domain/rhodanese-related sulfurtransferase
VTTSLQLTYGGVFLAVFANQVALPVPSIAFLMAAGALSAHGGMRTSIIVLLGVLGCLAGDGIWFWLGRKWGSKAMRLLCRFTADPRGCSRDAREKFHRYGLPVLCVAKFLPGLDAVMPPLGGAEGASVATFFALDTIGSFLWSATYVGLGYLFSNELDVAIGWVQHFGTALGIAIGVPLVLYAGWRGLALARMIRQLRLRRISPPMLARKLKSKSKVAVLDLLNFEEETDNGSRVAIPGAFRVDPSQLRKAPHITLPDNVKLILYCSSGSDAVSARAAVGLKRIGVDKVWVLEGGLKAWRERGYPVSQSLEAPEVVAERLGIKLPEPATRSNEGGDPRVKRPSPYDHVGVGEVSKASA